MRYALLIALLSLPLQSGIGEGGPSAKPMVGEARDCLRFYDLNRLCVPLPSTKLPVVEVGPNQDCSAGYYPPQTIDIRKLYSDTILLKETKDPLGEAPVMALFLGEGEALLLDTGNGSVAIREVIAPLIQERAVAVLNTHLHGDHIAYNDLFEVFAIETPAVKAHCGLTNEDFERDLSAACKTTRWYTPPEEQMLFGFRSFAVSRVLRDGHKLSLGGRALEVLYTPGHSTTSLALYDARHQLLFTGDSLYPGANPPLIHPGVGSDFAAYLATSRRFAALAGKVRLVIGAHGEGVMPRRVLDSFLLLVEARFAAPQDSADFIDDECPAGDWVLGNDPSK